MAKKRKNNEKSTSQGEEGSHKKGRGVVANPNDDTEKHAQDGRPPIPVTILSGFLGSGKTTLLQHILTSKEHNLKIAVIVNDMAELNIDGQTILRTTDIVKTKKEVVTLENGCICCTLRGDLIREIHRIQQTQEFDYVLIESTGIAEPQQVAESFCVDPQTMALTIASDAVESKMLLNAARLDTCVTVVDAVNFPQYLSSLKRFQDVFEDGLGDSEEGEGEKSISELMVEQVEFANVVLLNKVDLVSQKRVDIAKQLIKSLNPKARLICGSYGKIDLHQILNTELFDLQEASESRGWLLSLQNGGVDAAQGEADEYGVASFVYRARKPFHPKRLHAFLTQFFCFAEDWISAASSSVKDTDDGSLVRDTKESEELLKKYGSILRSKGSCWIAGRDDHEIGWAQCGRIIQLTPTAAWHCKTPPDEWAGLESEEDRERIQATFHTTDKHGKQVPYEFGDRRQEIVFIGTDLQQGSIEEELNQCLLTEKEMGCHTDSLPAGTYPDPLHPILVASGGAQSLFMIARPSQNQHIRILPGSKLSIQNLALHVHEDWEDRVRAVKVWLDKSDSAPHGVLLATMRPNTYEQHAMSLDLMPCDERGGEATTNRRIRVEVVPSKKPGKTTSSDGDDWIMACEVHVMAKVEPLPYSEGADDDDSNDEDDGEDIVEEEDEDEVVIVGDDEMECDGGMCPM